MEVALTVFNVGAGVGILVVAASIAYLAWRLTPLIVETRGLSADLRRLARLTEGELRPLVERAREVTRSAEVLAEDAAVRVARLGDAVDALDEAVARRADVTAERPGVRFGSVESAESPEGQSHL